MQQILSHVREELTACIACGECLVACPALAESLPIKTLNLETAGGPISARVARYAVSCYQCGACVPVCPVGLHRDAMMLYLKVRLLTDTRGRAARRQDRQPVATTSTS